ncbi:FolM Alternative dihydrofolate reductase 1 [Rhodovulum sp. PH10]|uniref:SDR family oxidoreductase n=1 Tax=Rhodovulum sp. PH10 TaxID=1187851 RepID=UPI00027C2C7A|nr:SDR family oxidoreductase [Rhodovulum sp. PH10]EJW10602.1 FolM Alternative dihydrofolate reductase 1 [Rhodovulum sp. PH10]
MSNQAVVAAPAALVTGGAQRIGRAIVGALARAGFAVAVHARASREQADALCAEIVAAGGRAETVVADLADHAAVERLVPAAVAAVGPLTLLVNNASEFEPDEIGRLDRTVFDRHMAVNLRAPVFLAEAFAAQAPAGEGADPSIVNLLDQRVYKPTPKFLSYGLSKSALHMATTTLAQALAPAVRVNAVAPGPTLPGPRQGADAFARQVKAVPLARGPSPEEIADAVLYLAKARSVTGETIAVDGGQRLAWQTPDAVGVEE